MKTLNELLRALRLRESSRTPARQQNSALAWQWPMLIRVTGYLRLSHATQRGFLSLRKLVGLAAIAAATTLPLKGNITVDQNNPYVIAPETAIETRITNNTGVTLDSLTLDYSDLFTQVANLPFNISRFDQTNSGYVDLIDDDFINQISSYIGFSIPDTGDVYGGWAGNIGADGKVSIQDNTGFGPQYNNTLNMDTILGLDNYLLTDPNTSMVWSVLKDEAKNIPNFVEGVEGGMAGLEFQNDGLGYGVIPEPSTYGAIVGALALGLALYNRRRKESTTDAH